MLIEQIKHPSMALIARLSQVGALCNESYSSARRYQLNRKRLTSYAKTILELTKNQNARDIAHKRWGKSGNKKQEIKRKKHYVCAWHDGISISEF